MIFCHFLVMTRYSIHKGWLSGKMSFRATGDMRIWAFLLVLLLLLLYYVYMCLIKDVPIHRANICIGRGWPCWLLGNRQIILVICSQALIILTQQISWNRLKNRHYTEYNYLTIAQCLIILLFLFLFSSRFIFGVCFTKRIFLLGYKSTIGTFEVFQKEKKGYIYEHMNRK